MWLFQFSPQHYTGDAWGEGALQWHSSQFKVQGWAGQCGYGPAQEANIHKSQHWKMCVQQVTVLLKAVWFWFHLNVGDMFMVGFFGFGPNVFADVVSFSLFIVDCHLDFRVSELRRCMNLMSQLLSHFVCQKDVIQLIHSSAAAAWKVEFACVTQLLGSASFTDLLSLKIRLDLFNYASLSAIHTNYCSYS